MNKVRVIPTHTREIKNILYPTREPGMWQRFTGFLARVFNVL